MGNLKQVKLYADGSSLGNPGPGGYGVILEYKGNQKEISGGEPNTTNNRMELKAVIEGLKALTMPCEIEVISDSNYVIKGINEWLEGWIRKEFKKVANVDLWLEYIEVSKTHKISGTWVKGHNGHPENERCDRLAFNEASRMKK